MRHFMVVTSPENFHICHDRSLWGDIEFLRISELRPGDQLVFYVKAGSLSLPTATGNRIAVGRLVGATAEVVGSAYRTSEHIWPDRRYPFIVDIRWTSPYPPVQYLDLRSPSWDITAYQGEFMREIGPGLFDDWADRLAKQPKAVNGRHRLGDWDPYK